MRSLVSVAPACLLFFTLVSSIGALDIHDLVIYEDAIWTKDNSPYVLNGFVLVDDQATLLIEPGTTVILKENTEFSINGTLKSLGSELEPVVIRGEDGGVRSGTISINSTNDIRIDFLYTTISGLQDALYVDSAKVNLSHTNILNVDGGIYVSGGDMNIENSMFSNIRYDAISGDDSIITIASTMIQNIEFGDALGLYNGSELRLTKGSVKNIGFGSALGIYESKAFISDSHFESGEDSAIELYGGSFDALLDMVDSSVSHFSTGIILFGGDVSLSRNIFEHNDNGVAVYEGDLYVRETSFDQNDDYALLTYDTKTIEAMQNWWGSANGPFNETNNAEGHGDAVSDGVLFSPWLDRNPRKTGLSSALFFPGVMSSRLYVQEDGEENKLWEPNRPKDVEKLFLNENGESITVDIYTKDIINEVTFAGANVYKGLTDYFNGLVKGGRIKEWQSIPYDWRMAPETILSSESIVTKLENMIQASLSGSVSLIGHSNGGLLVKQLIHKLKTMGDRGANILTKIDKIILVAVPQMGTPQAIGSLLHGDDLDLIPLIMNKERGRQLAHHMPSAHMLLPSTAFFTTVVDPVMRFASSTSNVFPIDSYLEDVRNAEDLFSFLIDEHNTRPENSSDTQLPIRLLRSLMDQARNAHDVLDNQELFSGLSVYHLVGWGMDTVQALSYSSKSVCPPQSIFSRLLLCTLHYRLNHTPVFTKKGDGTVVEKSASYLAENPFFVDINAYNNETVFRVNRDHASIFEIDSVRELLGSVMGTATPIALPQFISTTTTYFEQSKKRIRISIHSPVAIDVYDGEGLYTGRVDDFGQKSELIPNSFYSEYGDGKYIGLPYEGGFKVVLQGLDFGLFTLEIAIISGNDIVEHLIFRDIPTSRLMYAELALNNGEVSVLEIDSDGDKRVDFDVRAGYEFDPLFFLENTRKVLSKLCVPAAEADAAILVVDSLMNKIRHGETPSPYLKELFQRDESIEYSKVSDQDFVRELHRALVEILAF